VLFRSRTIGHDFAYYLLAELTILATFAVIYVAARPLVGAAGALVAVLIVDGLHYFSYTAVKFNHDVIQLPFWALAGYAFHRALRGRQLTEWALLGLALGLALWSKYFVVVLAAPMVAFVLIDREARPILLTPGPYIAAAVALVTAAPHLVWLVKTDFLPLAYAEHRAVLSRGWYDHFWHPFAFAAGQFFFLVPSLLIAAPLVWPRPAANETSAGIKADAFDDRIVTWLAFGPLVVVLAMAAVSGRGAVAMWGYPLFLFLGTWLVLATRRLLSKERVARILATWSIVFACLALAFIANYAVLPAYDHRYRAVFFPGSDLGREISQRYHVATGRPITYVIGSMWDGGNLAHYSPDHPRVLVDGKPERAPWIDLADLRSKGAVVVWTSGDLQAVPPQFRAVAVDAAVQPPLLLHYRRGDSSLYVGWAILQPRPSFAALISTAAP